MKRSQHHLRTALVLFLVWTVVGLVFTGIFYLIALKSSRAEGVWSILRSSLLIAYLWGALSPILYAVARKFEIDPKYLKPQNIMINLLCGLFITVVHSTIYSGMFWMFDPRLSTAYPTMLGFIRSTLVLQVSYSTFSLYFPTFFSIQALLFFRHYQREEAKNAELKVALSQAQLSALKMQLHPHFLFNSLHSISSLILLDPQRANTMVALLGDFLRQTLEHSNDQMVSLSAELEFLRCYLEIEKTRFEDRLSVNFDIEPEALDAEVPHLIVQPIVENAVKHGISPYSGPGHIEIRATQRNGALILRVSNSGHERATNGNQAGLSTNGLGLANVGSRLESIYGPAARLTILDLKEGGFEVELTMPLSVTATYS